MTVTLGNFPSEITKSGKRYHFDVITRCQINSNIEFLVRCSDGLHLSTHVVGPECLYNAYNTVDIIENIIDQHECMNAQRPDYMHDGPTNEQLAQYPALAAAWDEYCLVKRICGV